MKTTTEKSLSVLNDLIEICKDGQHGFQTAADDAKDAQLSQTFRQYAGQRATFIRELQERVRALGGDPEKTGSVTGSLHRGWIDLKAAISSNEPHAVLAEAERGEDAAVEAYRDALGTADIDFESRRLIERQAAGVQSAHDRVKELRDSPAFAHR